jgi:hypothetical protein
MFTIRPALPAVSCNVILKKDPVRASGVRNMKLVIQNKSTSVLPSSTTLLVA